VKRKGNIWLIFGLFFLLNTAGEVYAQCPQNNFVVDGFQLRDSDGNPFTVTDEYELGEEINGELWTILGGSSTNGYNLRFFFDIVINDVLIADEQYECLFSGVQAQQNVWVKVRDFSWNWGDVVDIKDIFIYWTTGTADPNSTCVISTKNNINSQCYGNLEGFTAAVPLFPKFDFQSNGICNTTIEFTSQTIGGSPPYNYTFEWDFDGLGTATGPSPVFDFPATGTYTIGLTADDGVTTTTIYKDIFIDPNFGIQVTIFPTKIDDDTGIIYVESVTGGTEPYSFVWTGPDGFYSTNRNIFGLSTGLYTLTVTDANGCSQTVEYFLDVASVLSLDLSYFVGEWSPKTGKVTLNWETNREIEPGTFEIQRKNSGDEPFQTIGTIQIPNSKTEKTTYSFQDTNFPFNQDHLYYRIRKKTEKFDYYSSVLLVKREIPKEMIPSWTLFPNPSYAGQNLELAYLGKEKISGGNVKLRLLNTTGELREKTVPLPTTSRFIINSYFGYLPAGFYILELQWNNHSEQIKILRN
jgi:PKD domain.